MQTFSDVHKDNTTMPVPNRILPAGHNLHCCIECCYYWEL